MKKDFTEIFIGNEKGFDKDTFVGVFQKNRNFGFVVPDDRKSKY